MRTEPVGDQISEVSEAVEVIIIARPRKLETKTVEL